ncbi:MAG: DUF1631 family protein [Pseudoxanthomonas sp.]
MSDLQPSIAGNRLVCLVRDAVFPSLGSAFADTLDGLHTPMLGHVNKMEGDREPYLIGLAALREHRDAILNGFCDCLLEAWRAAEAGESLSSLFDEALPEGRLDLLHDEELDVRLATEHLAEVIAREWKSELLLLNGYLTWLAPELRLGVAAGPYSPARIALAVYRGFTKMGTGARALAIRCCEREFVELVGPIYEGAYSRLHGEFGSPDSLSPRTRRITRIPVEGEEVQSEPDWLTRFFVSWEDGDGHASAASGAKKEDGTLPADLHRLLGISRKTRERLNPGRAHAADGQEMLSQRELIVALTLLQIAPQEVHNDILDAPDGLAAGLKRRIFAQVGQLGVAQESIRLAEADENVVDLIGLLFQEIFKESVLSRAQRHVLVQLLAPMTKVALQDRKLFLQATHPARRLLNALVEASDGNGGETPAQQVLLGEVERTVQRLAEDYDENLSTFRVIRADFSQFHAQYRAVVEQAELATAEQQRTEEERNLAISDARAKLAAQLAGYQIPAPVQRMLEADWPRYAATMEAAGKPQAAVVMLGGLLQAIRGMRPDMASDNERQTLADWLQPMWMALGRSRSEVAEMRQGLLEALRNHADSQAVAEDVATPLSPEAIAAETVPADLLEEEELREELGRQDRVTAGYLERLPTGSWLDFVDRNNRVQAGKLTWISPVSSRRMFVNRDGVRICVASVQELVAMAQLDRLRPHRDEDVFYSAMQGVIDRLSVGVG